MEKEARNVFVEQWGSIIILILIVGIGMGIWYTKQPVYEVNQYVKAMNQRDYGRLYDLFWKGDDLADFSRQEIINYMMKVGQDPIFMKLEKGKKIYQNQKQAFFEVVYATQKGSVKQMISLIKQDGEWQLLFPFEMSRLDIQAPEGTKVYINGLPVVADLVGRRSKKLLAGEYTVRMVYPNNLQSDSITKVKVPQVKEVQSPYDTMPVVVDAPIGTIVELAGVQKESSDGRVTFDKVLEGNYEVKVFDQNAYFETLIKEIYVSQDLKVINMNEMTLSAKGEQAFKAFINLFYESYIGSIRTGDVTGLERFIYGKNKEEIREDFEGWFVNHKSISSANMTIEIDALKVNAEGGVTANILEIVDMTNSEGNDTGKQQNRQYKVMLRWSTDFIMTPEGYELENREIVESMVAQKDTMGNWVQY